MFYDESVIKNVTDSSDIVSIISEYTHLEKKGASYVGCCPFHNEKTPSFYVNPDKGLYNCFGCHQGGNVVKFIMEKENIDFRRAIEVLAQKANITLPEKDVTPEERQRITHRKNLYGINKEAANYYYKCLRKNAGQKGKEYLTQKRGLSEDIQKNFALGYSPESYNNLIGYLKSKGYKEKDMELAGVIAKSSKGNYYDKFFGRVIFPIQDVNDNVIGFGARILEGDGAKYMNTPETEIYKKRENLFALNKARKTRRDELILVEGNMDVVSLHEAGFDNVVATLGTALTFEQARLIKKYKHNIILIYDSDNAGIEAAFKAIPILRDAGINVRVLNVEDAKDPDEYIKKFGTEKFEELLSKSIPYIEYELSIYDKRYDLSDSSQKKKYIEKVFDRIKNIKDTIDRELYIEKFSEKVNIDKEIIKSKLNGTYKKELYEPKENKTVKDRNNNDMRTEESIQNEVKQKQLISLMLNNQKIFEGVHKVIKPENMETEFLKSILFNLYKEYDNNTDIDLANFLNKFEELNDQNEIVSMAALMEKVKGADAVKSAERIVKGIILEDLDKQIEGTNQIIKQLQEKNSKDTVLQEKNSKDTVLQEENSKDIVLQEATSKLIELVKQKNNINKMNVLGD